MLHDFLVQRINRFLVSLESRWHVPEADNRKLSIRPQLEVRGRPDPLPQIARQRDLTGDLLLQAQHADMRQGDPKLQSSKSPSLLEAVLRWPGRIPYLRDLGLFQIHANEKPRYN